MLELIAVLLLGPPCVACIWWLLSRAWATAVEGGSVSEKTKKRQRKEFWILLTAAYALGIIQSLIQHKF